MWWVCDGSPRCLGITMVDVLRHSVVIEHIFEFPFEIRTESVHQARTWIGDTLWVYHASRCIIGQAGPHLTPGARCSDDCQWVEEGSHRRNRFYPAWNRSLHHLCALDFLHLGRGPLRKTPGVYQDEMRDSVRGNNAMDHQLGIIGHLFMHQKDCLKFFPLFDICAFAWVLSFCSPVTLAQWTCCQLMRVRGWNSWAVYITVCLSLSSALHRSLISKELSVCVFDQMWLLYSEWSRETNSRQEEASALAAFTQNLAKEAQLPAGLCGCVGMFFRAFECRWHETIRKCVIF